jgi:uncharacterized protein
MSIKKLFFATCLLMGGILWAAPHYPATQGYVTDSAHILDDNSRQTLESQLAAFEQATSNEIAVVTVPSLEGEDIESYANGLFSQWKIGKKGRDNGVLLLVAPTERKMRIEVGYGLESILPDGRAGEIIRENITPEFRQGNYSGGIVAGVDAIQKTIQGTYTSTGAHDSPVDSAALLFALIFLFFVLPYLLKVNLWHHYGYSSYPPSFGGGFGGGGSFGGFGGGSSGGGGASGGW